ncbi:MAG: urate hydroxylase PuuD, partial [Planktomarina sp.]|nr:urate hydroxylase PuuD [Planktomarina sp.]
LRSTHNNYLTLPVIFLMLSNHYPLSFGTPNAWIIACLIFLIGVTIRHYFNSMHAQKGRPNWTWAVTVILFIIIAWLSSLPGFDGDAEQAEAVPLSRYEMRFAEVESFDQAHEIVRSRCAMCHARAPAWDGLRWAPKGVLLETRADVARNARAIYLQAGVSHAMPPANITDIPQEDRALLTAWYRAGQQR